MTSIIVMTRLHFDYFNIRWYVRQRGLHTEEAHAQCRLAPRVHARLGELWLEWSKHAELEA